MKSAGDVVEILEAFDLTGSLRDAARLAGCSPILAAASGAERFRTKIRRATELATLVGPGQVDRALGLAAEAERFADGDLESILDHLRLMGDRTNELLDRDADDTLQPGTSAWELVGR